MAKMTWGDIAFSVFTGALIAFLAIGLVWGLAGCSTVMKVDVPKSRDVKVYVLRGGLVVRKQSGEAMKCEDPSLEGSRVLKPVDWNEVLTRQQYIRLKYASEAN